MKRTPGLVSGDTPGTQGAIPKGPGSSMPSVVSADPLLLQKCAMVGEQGWGMRTLFFFLPVFLVLLSIAALIIENDKRELLPQAGVGWGAGITQQGRLQHASNEILVRTSEKVRFRVKSYN